MRMPVGKRHPYSDYADCDICGESVVFYEGHEIEECLKNIVSRIETLEKRRSSRSPR